MNVSKFMVVLLFGIAVFNGCGRSNNGSSDADTTAPVITLAGSATVTVTQGDSYTDEGATASDNVDGELTSSITTVNPVNTATVGSYTVTYNVQDTAGNAATQVARTVNVVEAATTSKVTISGTVTYDLVPVNSNNIGLNYDSITQAKSKGVLVEAIDSSDKVIGTTSTDANGAYSIADIPASTDVKIRVYARLVKSDQAPTWDFKVVDNTNSAAQYVMEGNLTSSGTGTSQTRNLNASSGWDGTSYTEERTAAPFAILGVVYKAIEKIKTAQPKAVFSPLLINWSVNNISTSGDETQGQIGTSHYDQKSLYILGKADNDSDEYDPHVVAHEWGHYYEDKFSRSDNIGDEHGDGDRLDIRVAFGEGFGNAFSAMTLDNPAYYDTLEDGQAGGWTMNIEDDKRENEGWYSEYSVQRILYDLYDNTDDGNDTLSFGFTPLHNLFIGAQKNTTAFTSIFTFITLLKNAESGNDSEIDSIVSMENIAHITDLYGSGRTNLSEESPYITTTVDAKAKNICLTDTYGTANKLGNHKYIKFTVPDDGDYEVQAIQTSKTGSDAVIDLFKTAPFTSMGSYYTGHTFTLTTGEYLIDLSDDARKANSCFDIRIVTK